MLQGHGEEIHDDFVLSLFVDHCYFAFRRDGSDTISSDTRR